MLNGFNASLEEKLKMAEQAEQEVSRLQPLASEAPTLRAEKIKAQKSAERHRAKETAMEQAREAARAATDSQSQVPELLGNAARAVNELYVILKEVEARRQNAMHALALADRVDYEIELEDGEEHERSLDRDPRGLAYALAGRHGDSRVVKLLDELQPGFGLLSGCNMDDPLYRDVANFVVGRVTPAQPPQAAAGKKTAVLPPQPKIQPQPQDVPQVEEAPAIPAIPAIPAFLANVE